MSRLKLVTLQLSPDSPFNINYPFLFAYADAGRPNMWFLTPSIREKLVYDAYDGTRYAGSHASVLGYSKNMRYPANFMEPPMQSIC